MVYDVAIIGAGVVGGAAARKLSGFKVSVICLEKEADVCCGISKGNTGIIHTPALVHADTKKSEYTVRGNSRFLQLSKELGFGFQRTGALVLGFSEDDRQILESYRKQGEKAWHDFAGNSETLPEYRIIEKEELSEIEPGLNHRVLFALHAPEAGRIIPYEYGTALWENALRNGVRLNLNSRVINITRTNEGTRKLWQIETASKTYLASYVINAAGHGSVELGLMAGFKEHSISRIMGQYMILDRRKSPKINHILFQVPARGERDKGKGILVTNTVYGNLMIGPDAIWIDPAVSGSMNPEILKQVLEGARLSYPEIEYKYTIKTFAGIRPKPEDGDFIIEVKDGFINLCGIESPGLTSSPAMAKEILKLLRNEGLKLETNPDFQPERKPIIGEVLNLDIKEAGRRTKLEPGDPEKLTCRCEQVPECRIEDALTRGIPVTTLDGVKRRTRAGQGSCQGSFCSARVRKIISVHSEIPEADITQRGNQPDYTRVSTEEIKKLFGKLQEKPI